MHDLRPEGPRGPARAPREGQVPRLAAGARVQHCALDLVPALDERVLELRDEGAEIGRRRARVHLRDEQDTHGRSSFTIPAQIRDRHVRRSAIG